RGNYPYFSLCSSRCPGNFRNCRVSRRVLLYRLASSLFSELKFKIQPNAERPRAWIKAKIDARYPALVVAVANFGVHARIARKRVEVLCSDIQPGLAKRHFR